VAQLVQELNGTLFWVLTISGSENVRRFKETYTKLTANSVAFSKPEEPDGKLSFLEHEDGGDMFLRNTRRYNPDDRPLHIQCCENLESNTVK
jgi:hypothetical protein